MFPENMRNFLLTVAGVTPVLQLLVEVCFHLLLTKAANREGYPVVPFIVGLGFRWRSGLQPVRWCSRRSLLL